MAKKEKGRRWRREREKGGGYSNCNAQCPCCEVERGERKTLWRALCLFFPQNWIDSKSRIDTVEECLVKIKHLLVCLCVCVTWLNNVLPFVKVLGTLEKFRRNRIKTTAPAEYDIIHSKQSQGIYIHRCHTIEMVTRLPFFFFVNHNSSHFGPKSMQLHPKRLQLGK